MWNSTIFSAQFVLANAGSTIGKKVRGCYDGGSFKLLESHKTPCKLEGLPAILAATEAGDQFCKLDDVKGFLLAPLQKESRDLAVIEFMGRYLMFWIICFGVLAFSSKDWLAYYYIRLNRPSSPIMSAD